MAFLVTTTGTQNSGKPTFPISGIVTIEDIGYRELLHPTVSLDLQLEFTADELNDSLDLWTAIDNGWLTAVNELGVSITNPGQAVGSHPFEQHNNVDFSTKTSPEANIAISGAQTGSTVTWDGNSWVNTPTSYRHKQGIASSSWSVNHNLGRHPSGVTIVDGAGTVVEGQITFTDINNLTIGFTAVFSGIAYLS